MISSREFNKSFLLILRIIHFYVFVLKGTNFRYADKPNAYWTGYFTSRPALKGYVRSMSGYYQVRSPVSFCDVVLVSSRLVLIGFLTIVAFLVLLLGS